MIFLLHGYNPLFIMIFSLITAYYNCVFFINVNKTNNKCYERLFLVEYS